MKGPLTHTKERGNEGYSDRVLIFDIRLLGFRPHHGAESRSGTT